MVKDEMMQSLITDHMSFEDYLKGQKNNDKVEGFMNAYRLTGESKLEGITDFMDTLIENSCKFIVFAHHKSVMDGLEEFVKKRKVGYIRIDGQTSVDLRH